MQRYSAERGFVQYKAMPNDIALSQWDDIRRLAGWQTGD
jgi:hypothetical protein